MFLNKYFYVCSYAAVILITNSINIGSSGALLIDNSREIIVNIEKEKKIIKVEQASGVMNIYYRVFPHNLR